MSFAHTLIIKRVIRARVSQSEMYRATGKREWQPARNCFAISDAGGDPN